MTLTLPNGRHGFVFILDDKSLVSFTGPTSADETGRQAINAVNYASGTGEQIAAKGVCDGDPAVTDATITCEVTTDKGRFAVDFSSRGGPGVPVVGATP